MICSFFFGLNWYGGVRILPRRSMYIFLNAFLINEIAYFSLSSRIIGFSCSKRKKKEEETSKRNAFDAIDIEAHKGCRRNRYRCDWMIPFGCGLSTRDMVCETIKWNQWSEEKEMFHLVFNCNRPLECSGEDLECEWKRGKHEWKNGRNGVWLKSFQLYCHFAIIDTIKHKSSMWKRFDVQPTPSSPTPTSPTRYFILFRHFSVYEQITSRINSIVVHFIISFCLSFVFHVQILVCRFKYWID